MVWMCVCITETETERLRTCALVSVYLRAFVCVHVLVCCNMINVFHPIIYVFQNMMYVSMNFELFPKQRAINLVTLVKSVRSPSLSLSHCMNNAVETGQLLRVTEWDWLLMGNKRLFPALKVEKKDTLGGRSDCLRCFAFTRHQGHVRRQSFNKMSVWECACDLGTDVGVFMCGNTLMTESHVSKPGSNTPVMLRGCYAA